MKKTELSVLQVMNWRLDPMAKIAVQEKYINKVSDSAQIWIVLWTSEHTSGGGSEPAAVTITMKKVLYSSALKGEVAKLEWRIFWNQETLLG